MAITGTTEDSKPRKSSVANDALADALNFAPGLICARAKAAASLVSAPVDVPECIPA
jgi:hypothetical protein